MIILHDCPPVSWLRRAPFLPCWHSVTHWLLTTPHRHSSVMLQLFYNPQLSILQRYYLPTNYHLNTSHFRTFLVADSARKKMIWDLNNFLKKMCHFQDKSCMKNNFTNLVKFNIKTWDSSAYFLDEHLILVSWFRWSRRYNCSIIDLMEVLQNSLRLPLLYLSLL